MKMEILAGAIIVIMVVCGWKWYAERPTDEEGTRVVVEAWQKYERLATEQPVLWQDKLPQEQNQ